MREIRPSGSEGGGTGQPVLPTPIRICKLKQCGKMPRCFAALRVCDFFEFARKRGLKTKDLSASK